MSPTVTLSKGPWKLVYLDPSHLLEDRIFLFFTCLLFLLLEKEKNTSTVRISEVLPILFALRDITPHYLHPSVFFISTSQFLLCAGFS